MCIGTGEGEVAFRWEEGECLRWGGLGDDYVLGLGWGKEPPHMPAQGLIGAASINGLIKGVSSLISYLGGSWRRGCRKPTQLPIRNATSMPCGITCAVEVSR